MAEAEIVFETPTGELLVVVADAVVSERHRVGGTPTKHPVEVGAAITDHYIPGTDRLSLDVRITDSPIRSIEPEPESERFMIGEVSGAFEAVSLDLPAVLAPSRLAEAGPPARAIELEERQRQGGDVRIWTPAITPVGRMAAIWQTIIDARDQAFTATIVTETRTYESMVLADAEALRGSARWLEIALEFEGIRQVETRFVEIAQPARPRNRRQRQQGSTPTEETTEQEREQSLLSQGIEAVRGLF